MDPQASTPEELDALLEDAFVIRDREALTGMFEPGAVLVIGEETHGSDQIASALTSLWDRDRTYVADPRRIVQARDTALILAEHDISVAHRAPDGAWRYAIAVLRLDPPAGEDDDPFPRRTVTTRRES